MRLQNGRATVTVRPDVRHHLCLMHGSPCGQLGREIPKGNDMTSPQARKAAAPAVDLSVAKVALWLSLTAFLALVVLYFVGLDQGATSVFGDNMYVHEFVHDARHLLGFPCH